MQKYTGNNNVMKRPEVKQKHLQQILKVTSTQEWKDKKAKGDKKQKLLYLVITPDDIKIIINGLNQFCKDNNLNQSHCVDVSNGNRRLCGNFKIYHFDDHKRYFSFENYISLFKKKNNVFISQITRK